MISDKSRIRQSFSAACNTYDNVAELQRTVGKTLLHTIDTTQLAGALLDVGCGTGFLSAELLKITPCDT
ncbi:MAG: malonyl-ACP O-methyltransferase BioC, partial [Methylococcaceae bacterium]